MSTDRQWAAAVHEMFGRGGPVAELLYVELRGDPWSKQRPKFSRRGKAVATYQPAEDAAAEARTRAKLQHWVLEPFPGNVMLACRFYRSDRQRIDADNLLKHVCDAADKVLWADDSQATLVIGEVLLDPVSPRTVIVAGPHRSNLLRGEDRARSCEHCGARFLPGSVGQRFCSRPCGAAGRVSTAGTLPLALDVL